MLQVATFAARPDSGDPLDQALHAAAGPLPEATRLADFPFTEARRRETVVWRLAANDPTAFTKGAPETVLATCALSAQERADWLARVEEFARSGHKVIACARREMPAGVDHPRRTRGGIHVRGPAGLRGSGAGRRPRGDRRLHGRGHARHHGHGGPSGHGPGDRARDRARRSGAQGGRALPRTTMPALRSAPAPTCTWWRAPPRRRSSRWCRRCKPMESSSRSRATASTMSRRCAWPTSAWPWASAARAAHARSRRWCCSTTTSGPSSMRWPKAASCSRTCGSPSPTCCSCTCRS